MQKVEFSDGEFILREEKITEIFVKPSKGDFIIIGNVNYQVDTIIHNYEKEKLMVVCHEFKK